MTVIRGEGSLRSPLRSDAFHWNEIAGWTLDPRCTSWGDGSSPELRWGDPPPGTRSFAVLFERLLEAPEAEAGTAFSFCHWLVYNIPLELRHLPPGIPPQESLVNGIYQGLHSGGRLGYLAPTPAMKGRRPGEEPVGRYRFRLLALREPPEMPPRLTRATFEAMARPFVLGELEETVVLQALPEVAPVPVSSRGRVA